MLKKETLVGLTVGQLLAIIGLVIGIYSSWSNTKTDIIVLQNEMKNMRERRIDDNKKIDEIDKKLDKIYFLLIKSGSNNE